MPPQPSPSQPSTLGVLTPYLRAHAPALAGAGACVAGGALATMGLVPLAHYAALVLARPTLTTLDQVVAGLVGLYALKGLFGFGQAALAQRVALAVAAGLREEGYAHLLDAELRGLATHRPVDLSSRLVQDVGVVKDALATVLAEVAPSVTVLAYSLGYALWLNWRLAIATFVGAPLVGWAIALFGRHLHTRTRDVQARVSDVFVRASETLAALPVIRAFGAEAAALAQFTHDNRLHQATTWRAAALQAAQPATIAFLQTLAIGAVLWLGGYEIMRGRLSGADLIAFAAAVGIGVDPILALSQAWGRLQAAGGALARVKELLALPRRRTAASAPAGPSSPAKLEVSGLWFGYDPARPVLCDLSFSVNPGEVVALVGPSGGGKSTLAALLLGLYDPDAGHVLLDGCDLRSPGVARAIAYVPQDPTLFDGSIAYNVALGRPDATRAEIEAACRLAQAHDFITALPDGYDAHVGERGATLSGGERQRLAIARALLVNPRVLVLDEATAALDNTSAASVTTALAKAMANRTTVMVAHRLDTIAHADRVYVIEQGRITDAGPPAQLLASRGAFWRLSQANPAHDAGIGT